jgi:hypothetical protein
MNEDQMELLFAVLREQQRAIQVIAGAVENMVMSQRHDVRDALAAAEKDIRRLEDGWGLP